MPRLNVYLSSEAYELANEWRDSVNLSDICSRAILDELGAKRQTRDILPLLAHLQSKTALEAEVSEAFQLQDIVIAKTPNDTNLIRESLGLAAAAYLDATLSDHARIGVCGGRQMWNVVRNLKPRNISARISALGFSHADPDILHVHANTLATILSLLYSPRSTAEVIGSAHLADFEFEHTSSPIGAPIFFVIGSCSRFAPGAAFAKLLGEKNVAQLTKYGAVGDYAYCFFDAHGHDVKPALSLPQRRISYQAMLRLSARADARTILVAGGADKTALLKRILVSRICNTLITDEATAQELLQGE